MVLRMWGSGSEWIFNAPSWSKDQAIAGKHAQGGKHADRFSIDSDNNAIEILVCL
jgi:hypothetical protein